MTRTGFICYATQGLSACGHVLNTTLFKSTTSKAHWVLLAPL